MPVVEAELPVYLTAKQVAALLDVEYERVRTWIREKKVPFKAFPRGKYRAPRITKADALKIKSRLAQGVPL